jgi:hypothetical protein
MEHWATLRVLKGDGLQGECIAAVHEPLVHQVENFGRTNRWTLVNCAVRIPTDVTRVTVELSNQYGGIGAEVWFGWFNVVRLEGRNRLPAVHRIGGRVVAGQPGEFRLIGENFLPDTVV